MGKYEVVDCLKSVDQMFKRHLIHFINSAILFFYDALGFTNIDSPRRICVRKTPFRGPASSLFWALGGQQVGRADIVGWRDLIAPVLSDKSLPVSIWPFNGRFHELISQIYILIVDPILLKDAFLSD